MGILLDTMSILEAAEILRVEAKKIAEDKGISEQEAWSIFMKEISNKLGENEKC